VVITYAAAVAPPTTNITDAVLFIAAVMMSGMSRSFISP
jgi:hypothetical protein